MKSTLLKAISFLLVLTLLLPTSISAFALENSDNSVSSASASSGISKMSKAKATTRSKSEDARILLIQDTLPWDSDANTVILDEIGQPYNVISTSQFINTELWNYDLVIFANDQSFRTYSNYAIFKEYLELFTQMGGVIVFGAGDFGWASGEISAELPGGVKKNKNYSYRDYVSDSTHPIVTGELTNDGVLTDSELYENYCSHNSFVESTLPKGSKVIIRASNDKAPTLVEYPIGNGTIIASTLTWEFNYYHGGKSHPEGGTRGNFSKIAMKDMFLYALSKAQKSAENKFKIKVTAKNSSGNNVAVKDAFVNVYDNANGQTKKLYTVKTDSSGIAKISVAGLSVNQFKNLTVSAYINDSIGSNINGTNRNALFNQFGTTENGEPIRYIYQLHSETIDANGNWKGKKLPNDIEKTVTLMLSEPRLLVNLAVSYLNDTNDVNYVQKIKNSMSYASQQIAQSSDGHVMFNKILLVPTNNRTDFANTNNTASMADIQIQATLTEGNNSNMQIWSNAHVTGFYSDDIVSFSTDGFDNIPTGAFANRSGFYRVQLSGLEGAGWNNEIGTEAYSTTICHELGHYLLGFFDEYMDGNEDNWGGLFHGCPYSERFGLMDNQHSDIEMSRNSRDYSYLKGNFGAKATKDTRQSYVYRESCESSLSDLLTNGNEDPFSNDNHSFSYNSGRYNAHYTLAPSSSNDRTASYNYSALTDDNFITVNSRIIQNNARANEKSLAIANVKSNVYSYISDSNCIIGYLNSTTSLSANCYSGDSSYKNGLFKSVDESVVVDATSNGTISGEFYGEVGCFNDIDFSSLSWFKYSNGKWSKVTSEITQDQESMNYCCRCNYSGNGVYVIMAKDAYASTINSVSVASYKNSKNKDGLTTITISDKNDLENIAFYNIYYSKSDFEEINANVTKMTVLPGESEYAISFDERDVIFYVKIEAVAQNGSKSVLSKSFKLTTGAADRDNDGIPDWYCDKYLLWGDDESKDIANSDENNNGLTNLEEYLAGNDPTQYSDSNIDIEESSITIKYKDSTDLNVIYVPGHDIVYESSNTNVAIVDSNGKVTAVGKGTATITASIPDLGASDSCTVNVKLTWWQWLIKIILFGWIWY